MPAQYIVAGLASAYVFALAIVVALSPIRERFVVEQPGKCVMSEWQDAEPCQKDCTKRRTRRVLAGSKAACGPTQDRVGCSGGMCDRAPHECVLGKWKDVTPCSAPCGKSGQKTQRRNVLREASCGRTCPDAREQTVECVGACRPTARQRCVYTKWIDDGPCKDGRRPQKRWALYGKNCAQQDRFKDCPPPAACADVAVTTAQTDDAEDDEQEQEQEEEKQVTSVPASSPSAQPQDCVMSDWKDATECDCASSKKSQSRTVQTQAAGGGRPCGELTQVVQCSAAGMTACRTSCSPVKERVGGCVATTPCGPGQQQFRVRSAACSETMEFEPCNAGPCSSSSSSMSAPVAPDSEALNIKSSVYITQMCGTYPVFNGKTIKTPGDLASELFDDRPGTVYHMLAVATYGRLRFLKEHNTIYASDPVADVSRVPCPCQGNDCTGCKALPQDEQALCFLPICGSVSDYLDIVHKASPGSHTSMARFPQIVLLPTSFLAQAGCGESGLGGGTYPTESRAYVTTGSRTFIHEMFHMFQGTSHSLALVDIVRKVYGNTGGYTPALKEEWVNYGDGSCIMGWGETLLNVPRLVGLQRSLKLAAPIVTPVLTIDFPRDGGKAWDLWLPAQQWSREGNHVQIVCNQYHAPDATWYTKGIMWATFFISYRMRQGADAYTKETHYAGAYDVPKNDVHAGAVLVHQTGYALVGLLRPGDTQRFGIKLFEATFLGYGQQRDGSGREGARVRIQMVGADAKAPQIVAPFENDTMNVWQGTYDNMGRINRVFSHTDSVTMTMDATIDGIQLGAHSDYAGSGSIYLNVLKPAVGASTTATAVATNAFGTTKYAFRILVVAKYTGPPLIQYRMEYPSKFDPILSYIYNDKTVKTTTATIENGIEGVLYIKQYNDTTAYLYIDPVATIKHKGHRATVKVVGTNALGSTPYSFDVVL